MVQEGQYTVKNSDVYQEYFNSLPGIEEIYVFEKENDTTEIQEMDMGPGAGEFRTVQTEKLKELIEGGYIE